MDSIKQLISDMEQMTRKLCMAEAADVDFGELRKLKSYAETFSHDMEEIVQSFEEMRRKKIKNHE